MHYKKKGYTLSALTKGKLVEKPATEGGIALKKIRTKKLRKVNDKTLLVTVDIGQVKNMGYWRCPDGSEIEPFEFWRVPKLREINKTVFDPISFEVYKKTQKEKLELKNAKERYKANR